MSLGAQGPSQQAGSPRPGLQGSHSIAAATDLLEKMLELDVDKRLTASQALTHPFFEPFRDPEEETEAQQPLDDSLEHEKLTVDEWKRKSGGLRPLPPSASLAPTPSWRLPSSEQASPPACTSFSLSWADFLLHAVSAGGKRETTSPACPTHLELPCFRSPQWVGPLRQQGKHSPCGPPQRSGCTVSGRQREKGESSAQLSHQVFQAGSKLSSALSQRLSQPPQTPGLNSKPPSSAILQAPTHL